MEKQEPFHCIYLWGVKLEITSLCGIARGVRVTAKGVYVGLEAKKLAEGGFWGVMEWSQLKGSPSASAFLRAEDPEQGFSLFIVILETSNRRFLCHRTVAFSSPPPHALLRPGGAA